jgi:hypothetical protein
MNLNTRLLICQEQGDRNPEYFVLRPDWAKCYLDLISNNKVGHDCIHLSSPICGKNKYKE